MTRTDPPEWSGRHDGPGEEHRRWHSTIVPATQSVGEPGVLLVGFASDEGVRRNHGRQGAAQGPPALRNALSSLALHQPLPLYDAGDVVVDGNDLERAQDEFAAVVAEGLRDGHLTVGLGGGHEIAYASYRGVTHALGPDTNRRLGVLNIDAHFDLRDAEHPTSGTGFAQMAAEEKRAGREFAYAVVGISETSNTTALFERADELGVQYLLDRQCRIDRIDSVRRFVTHFIDDVDDLYVTLDLDVLPAAVAPGVSAPAAYGVAVDVVDDVIAQAAASGKLIHFDVAELNPRLDFDQQTARTAARLIHTLVTSRKQR